MKHSLFTHHSSLFTSEALCTLLFGVAVLLFFGLAYPHHLHYQEQYQLFLFDSTYMWDIIKLPGGIADLLGRFCTQFFLFAWVGALIIALLLVTIQLLVLRLAKWGWLNGLSFVPSFLLWIFLLDENALLGGVWAVLLTLLWITGTVLMIQFLKRKMVSRRTVPVILLIAIPIIYWIAIGGSHYHRYPTVIPYLLYSAWLSAVILPLLMRLVVRGKWIENSPAAKFSLTSHLLPLTTFILVAVVMGTLVWKNANFKAEKVMQYDFMARYQQWNRILATANAEKPNNQIGVTVQNLALAMHGMLADHLFEYNQNGIAGLLPDIQRDATSPLPTAEAFYQLGMIYAAQRTVFEAQEAILDFQKSARCYKRLAQTNLINGSYEVARKYLMALQKTLFYREWANETLSLLANEEAIAKHPEYGRLRQLAYDKDFYFGDHLTPEVLERLFISNTDNRLAFEYLKAYYMLTNDRESYVKLMEEVRK